MAKNNNSSNGYSLVNIGPIMVPYENTNPNIPGTYGYMRKAYDNMNNYEFHSGSNMFPGFKSCGCGIELQTMKY